MIRLLGMSQKATDKIRKSNPRFGAFGQEAIRDIIVNPETAEICPYPDVLTVLTGGLVFYATANPEHLEAIGTYMVRVFDAGYTEFPIMFMRSYMRDNPAEQEKIAASKLYKKLSVWMTEWLAQ